MFNCNATVNLDTEFRVPRDCLREGDVSCRVVRTDCRILNTWDHWVTFEVSLLLKITIRSGELICSFHRTVVVKESAWLEPGNWVKGCDVVAAVCRCVVHRGRVHCNATVKVEFCLKHHDHFHCCGRGCECGCGLECECECECGCGCERRCWRVCDGERDRRPGRLPSPCLC